MRPGASYNRDMSKLPSWPLRAGASLAALAATAGVAAAQRAGEAPVLDYNPPWLGILYSVVFLAGVAVVSFKNARRTHLD